MGKYPNYLIGQWIWRVGGLVLKEVHDLYPNTFFAQLPHLGPI